MRHVFLLFALFTVQIFQAQVVQIIPTNATTDSDITLIFDATQGNGELSNYQGDVYLYTGVITSESSNGHDWKHVQADWFEVNPELLMTAVGNNKYSISFNIRALYGISESEEVLQLALLFVNEDYSLIGRNADLSDIFVDINKTFTGNYVSYVLSGQTLLVQTETGVIEIGFFNSQSVKVEYVANGSSEIDTSFSVVGTPEFTSVSFTEELDFLSFKSSELEIFLKKNPLKLFFVSETDTVLRDFEGFTSRTSGGSCSFEVSENEAFYGGGSRAVPINRRGSYLPTWNQAHYGYGNGEATLNLSIPMFISSEGYGLFVDNQYLVKFDLAATSPNVLAWNTSGGRMCYYFMLGDFTSILDTYTDITGKQPLPPVWALGYIQSKFGYHTETEARQIVQDLKNQGFPLDALVLDLYWFGDLNAMGNLDWDNSNWQNPVDMMSDFQQDNIKTILISEPYFTLESDNFWTAHNSGYFTKNWQGETYPIWGFWAGDAALLDITNSAAQNWMWQFYENRYLEGAAGWWTDLGEPETHFGDMYHAFGQADAVHNVYNQIWARMIAEKHAVNFPNDRLFNLTRSGYAGIQNYSTFPWSGDIQRTFSGLQAQIPVMLGAGMSGVGYMHSDVGGFTGEEGNGDLFSRWVQYGTFAPVLRVHGHGTDIEPTTYAEPYRSIARDFIRLRYRMLPYNYSLAWRNSISGIPLATQLNFYEPENQQLNNISDQYFWGENLLVAPILEANQTERNVIFPQGTWINFFDDTRYDSGIYTISAPKETIPVFAKAGSFIPMTEQIMNTTEYSSDNLHVLYFPDETVTTSSFTLFADNGTSTNSLQTNQYQTITFNGTFDSTDIEINFQTEGNYSEKPEKRSVILEIRRIGTEPLTAIFDNTNITKSITYENLTEQAGTYFFDIYAQKLFAHIELNSEYHSLIFRNTLSSKDIQNPEQIIDFAVNNIYPNPCSEYFVMTLDIVQESDFKVDIFDSFGKLVHSEELGELTKGRSLHAFDTHSWASGVYFAKITSKQTQKTTAIVRI